MKRRVIGLVSILAICAWGCASKQQTQVAHTLDGEGLSQEVTYCGKCGQVKGTDQCCTENAEVCTKCSLHKGSPLCCTVNNDAAGKDLCGKCGQITGSESCCAKDAEVCEHCKLHKGSTLCCKLADQSTTEEKEDRS